MDPWVVGSGGSSVPTTELTVYEQQWVVVGSQTNALEKQRRKRLLKVNFQVISAGLPKELKLASKILGTHLDEEQLSSKVHTALQSIDPHLF